MDCQNTLKKIILNRKLLPEIILDRIEEALDGRKITEEQATELIELKNNPPSQGSHTEKIEELKNGMKLLESELEKVKKEKKDLDTELTDVKDELDKVKKEKDNLNSKVDGVQNQIDTDEFSLDKIIEEEINR